MKIYARLSSQDYAAGVTKITAQKIHAISSRNLPTVDAGSYIARALEEVNTLDDNTHQLTREGAASGYPLIRLVTH